MGYDWLDAVEHKIGQLKRKEKTAQVLHDLADAEDLKSLYDRFVMLVYPANKASPPDLAIRRRKCDGGGYIVPL